MLAAHYTQNQPVNKSFPGDRLKWVFDQDLDSTAKLVLTRSQFPLQRQEGGRLSLNRPDSPSIEPGLQSGLESPG